MDTVAASILASEVPASKEVNNQDFSENENYESILDHTSPFNAQKDKIFTNSMKINVFSTFIYQQAVLVYIYFYGWFFWCPEDTYDCLSQDSGPNTWHQEKFFDTNNNENIVATHKNQDLTFVYQVFFMM